MRALVWMPTGVVGGGLDDPDRPRTRQLDHRGFAAHLEVSPGLTQKRARRSRAGSGSSA